MGVYSVEHLRLRREAVELLSLEEGIHMQIAVITKVGAVRAAEEALPVLRALAILLSILSIFAGGRARYVGSASNARLQKYIPVGLFGSTWKGLCLPTSLGIAGWPSSNGSEVGARNNRLRKAST